MKKELPEKLKEFLLANYCHRQFISNLDWNDKSAVQGLKTSQAVSLAFIWVNTQEGQDFWSDIDKKYYSYFVRSS